MSLVNCLHPGGLSLTDKLLAVRPLHWGATVIDIGCGTGSTVAHLRREHHLSAIGLEKDPKRALQCRWTILGDAENLPFLSNSFDAVFFECSLSKIQNPNAALAEAFRVLKPDGGLHVSDMFANGKERQFTGLLGRIESKETVLERLHKAGFNLTHWQERLEELRSYWAQLLFYSDVTQVEQIPPADQLKQTKCSYFISVFEKSAPLPTLKKQTTASSPLDSWVWQKTGINDNASKGSFFNWQLEQVVKTIEYAKHNSSFYRTHLANIVPESVLQTGNLTQLPFTDSRMLSNESARLLCTSLGQVSRIHTIPTSGSTGPPKRIYFTDEDLNRTVDFFSVGMKQVMGNGKSAAILMSDSKPGSIATLLQEGLRRIGVEATIYGTLQSQPHFNPGSIIEADCLVGLPADIHYLCKVYPYLKPSCVLMSADYIPIPILQTLEKQWNCPLFCHYGMSETGYGLAVQCLAAEGHHVRSADFFLEIIHPETGINQPSGQEGEIVITSLCDNALPLIRYRTGDWGHLLQGPCSCGSTLPRLGRVRGRIQHLRAPYNIHWLDDIVFADPHVFAYQAIKEKEQITLLIEGESISPQTVKIASAAMGTPIEVAYQPVCFSAPAGKRRVEFRD